MKFLSPIDVDGYISLITQNPGTTPTKFLIQDANGRIAFRTGQELKVDIGAGYTSVLKHQVKAGVAINKGQAVYVTSADGTNMIVGLASNATEATSSKTMGLLSATVAANGFADVITEGLLAGLNTIGANAGDPVWLGTNGNLIYGLANKPYAPNHLVFIGIVTRVNANNGEIFVKAQNGFELDEIHDVDLKTTTKVNGHLLGYNGSLWVNKTIAEWLGYTPYDASNPAGYISSYTETDPIYTASSWYSTANNASNWNTAYNWGNHALAGYVPEARTITINGTSYDLSANRSWTVTASETDTLATVTGRGNTTTGDVNINGKIRVGSFPNSTVNNGEAWIGRAADRSAGTMTVQLGGNLDRKFEVVDYGWTTVNFSVNGYGAAEASGSMRAPIFYDSNNTGYYLDPASSSNLDTINAARFASNQGSQNPNSSHPGYGIRPFYSWNLGQAYNDSAGYSNGISIGSHPGDQSYGFQIVQNMWDDQLYFRRYNGGWLGWRTALDSSNYTGYRDWGGNAIYAGILYDGNNTGYYVDPNNSSRVNTINADALVSYGVSYAAGTGGFASSTYAVGVRNPIWRFGNADGYGLSYFQGTAGNASQDTIGFHFGTATSAGSQFKMRGDGVFFASNDIIAFSSSDRQLKNNITPIKNALEKVKQIGGYTFDWNDNQEVHSGHDVGVIAQEIELVLPEVVTTRDTGFKAVKYEKIVPLLIEAIKEQQKQIEELKELINQLIKK